MVLHQGERIKVIVLRRWIGQMEMDIATKLGQKILLNPTQILIEGNVESFNYALEACRERPAGTRLPSKHPART